MYKVIYIDLTQMIYKPFDGKKEIESLIRNLGDSFEQYNIMPVFIAQKEKDYFKRFIIINSATLSEIVKEKGLSFIDKSIYTKQVIAIDDLDDDSIYLDIASDAKYRTSIYPRLRSKNITIISTVDYKCICVDKISLESLSYLDAALAYSDYMVVLDDVKKSDILRIGNEVQYSNLPKIIALNGQPYINYLLEIIEKASEK